MGVHNLGTQILFERTLGKMNHHREKWELLLSERRHSDIGPVFDPCGGNPFENDYGRLVMSAPVRRLQDKTQLFPLERSTYIRTRLTHSLEVSYIAGLLGQEWCINWNYS